MQALAMYATSILSKAAKPLKAEVVGFRDNKVILMPLGDLHSIGPGLRCCWYRQTVTVQVGSELAWQGAGWTWTTRWMALSYLAECRITLHIMNRVIRLMRPRVVEPLALVLELSMDC